MNIQKTSQQAQAVLEHNRRSGYTLPSSKLYPFQWNWDAGFIAVGYAALKKETLFWEEIETLLSGQWENGFLPHIVFHQHSSEYFPGPSIWKSSLCPDAPEKLQTSGIAQPPVLGLAVEHGLKILGGYDRSRLEKVLPKLENLYLFYQEFRDLKNQGAITIYHPWESGMDNSPLWDLPISRIGALEKWHHLRKDLDKVADVRMRPSHEEYDAYLTMVEHLKKDRYDEVKVAQNYPFQVKDILTTALFIASAESLIRIMKYVDYDSSKLSQAILPTKNRWQETFCDGSSHELPYSNYDVLSQEFIPLNCPYALLFLLSSDVPSSYLDQVQKYLDVYEQKMQKYPYPNLYPSVYPWDEKFNSRCYWKGPVWININWLIYQGLKKHDLKPWAQKTHDQMLQLVAQSGFYEYFDPLTGEGIGADSFSWTAALTLDLLED